jgi:hypothetical protein
MIARFQSLLKIRSEAHIHTNTVSSRCEPNQSVEKDLISTDNLQHQNKKRHHSHQADDQKSNQFALQFLTR